MSGWSTVGAAAFAAVLTSSVGAMASTGVDDALGDRRAKWRSSVVRLTVDDSLSEIGETALDAVLGSVLAWRNLNQRLPTLVVDQGEVDEVGYHKGASNVNTVRFAPHGTEAADGALAITVLTFDLEASRILDADIVINGEHAFSSGALPGEMDAGVYDLQNVLSHEMGHFLGLGEEYEDASATMYAYSLPGETHKRDLEERDIADLDRLYGEATVPDAGFGCGVAGPSDDRGALMSFVLLLGVFSLVALRLRRFRSAVTLMGLTLLMGGTVQEPSPSKEVIVSALHSEWREGLVVTHAQVRRHDCESCATKTISVYGGRVGNVVQQVGALRPLRIGDSVRSVPTAGIHLTNDIMKCE